MKQNCNLKNRAIVEMFVTPLLYIYRRVCSPNIEKLAIENYFSPVQPLRNYISRKSAKFESDF